MKNIHYFMHVYVYIVSALLSSRKFEFRTRLYPMCNINRYVKRKIFFKYSYVREVEFNTDCKLLGQDNFARTER